MERIGQEIGYSELSAGGEWDEPRGGCGVWDILDEGAKCRSRVVSRELQGNNMLEWKILSGRRWVSTWTWKIVTKPTWLLESCSGEMGNAPVMPTTSARFICSLCPFLFLFRTIKRYIIHMFNILSGVIKPII